MTYIEEGEKGSLALRLEAYAVETLAMQLFMQTRYQLLNDGPIITWLQLSKGLRDYWRNVARQSPYQ
jgi:hypothetical protein